MGTFVRAKGAGLAFTDWPLMDGKLVPALGGANTAMFAHRVLAALVFVLRALRARAGPHDGSALADPRAALHVAASLFVAQIVVGAAQVWTHLRPWAVVLHVALSVLIWSTLVTLATVACGIGVPAEREIVPEDVEPEEAVATSDASFKDRVQAYYRLTKPEIIFLLLVTTVPAMFLAAHAVPSPSLILATLVGGTLAAGSANAINQYLDRDIDEVMRRTRRRPLPSAAVTPERALRFGFFLGAVSFFFLAITVNVLAAELALSAIAFYVFVYTMWLKRTTTQNIVIGGAAGAVPALVGWAAVTGSLAAPAWILFAIVFVWTPPHFWALAMRYRGDYAAAGRADASGGEGRAGDPAPDLPLRPGALRRDAPAGAGRTHGPGVRGDSGGARRRVRLQGAPTLADRRPGAVLGSVQVLDLVPRGALRSRRRRRPASPITLKGTTPICLALTGADRRAPAPRGHRSRRGSPT